MPIKVEKSIYDRPQKSDGLRLLTTRFKPFGIGKRAYDLWLTDLGPSAATVKTFLAGRISWPQFARAYRREIRAQTPLLKLLAHLHRQRGQTITLLCACKDAHRCHRSLLGAEIERQARRLS